MNITANKMKHYVGVIIVYVIRIMEIIGNILLCNIII